MPAAALLAIFVATGITSPPVERRVQPVFVCWESDMEFPVDCDDED